MSIWSSPFRSRSPVAIRSAAILGILLCAPFCERKTEARPTPAQRRPAPTRAAPANADASGYEFRPAEKRAVEEFLRANPDLRLATDADRRPSEDGEDVQGLYGVYHPYFVRGDANDDGILDFAIAFVRRDSDRDSPWFSVVLFTGRANGEFSAGTVLERDITLADGDLSIDRDSIVVTPDVSDDVARRYRWDPSKQRHVFVRDEPEEPTAVPPPAQI